MSMSVEKILCELGLHQYAVHTEKRFECAHCGEKGSGVKKFKEHMRKHNTQKTCRKIIIKVLIMAVIEAPRFLRKSQSLKSGYFCALVNTGASEV